MMIFPTRTKVRLNTGETAIVIREPEDIFGYTVAIERPVGETPEFRYVKINEIEGEFIEQERRVFHPWHMLDPKLDSWITPEDVEHMKITLDAYEFGYWQGVYGEEHSIPAHLKNAEDYEKVNKNIEDGKRTGGKLAGRNFSSATHEYYNTYIERMKYAQAEGYAQGLEIGSQKLAKRLYSAGKDEEFVVAICGITKKQSESYVPPEKYKDDFQEFDASVADS
jgi:hypothetical protein